MRTLRLVLGLLVLGIVGAGLAEAATKKKIVQQPLSALKWTPVAPGAPILGADAWKINRRIRTRFETSNGSAPAAGSAAA